MSMSPIKRMERAVVKVWSQRRVRARGGPAKTRRQKKGDDMKIRRPKKPRYARHRGPTDCGYAVLAADGHAVASGLSGSLAVQTAIKMEANHHAGGPYTTTDSAMVVAVGAIRAARERGRNKRTASTKETT